LWLPTRDSPAAELTLAISLDVASGGWLVEMTTSSRAPGGEPTYSRTIIPVPAMEQGTHDAYLDALLIMHLRFLGFT
jgi:hypothetical protein